MLKQSAIALIALLSVGSISAAPQKEGRNGLKPLLKQLDLTEEQRQDLRQMMKENKAEMELVGQERGAFRQQLMLLIHTDTFDQTAVQALLENNQQSRAQKRLQKAQNQHKLFHSLTENQQDKFVSLLVNTKGNSRGNRNNKMFKRLGLSDQQKASIKQIKVSYKATKESAKETLRARRQAEFNLIKADLFDTNAWQTLQNQYQQSVLQIALKKAEMRNQVWNQLSDEQQLKATERMSKIKQKRHARRNAI